MGPPIDPMPSTRLCGDRADSIANSPSPCLMPVQGCRYSTFILVSYCLLLLLESISSYYNCYCHCYCHCCYLLASSGANCASLSVSIREGSRHSGTAGSLHANAKDALGGLLAGLQPRAGATRGYSTAQHGCAQDTRKKKVSERVQSCDRSSRMLYALCSMLYALTFW